MGKRKQGRLDLSPLEYMVCLVLLQNERTDEGKPDASRGMSGYDILLALNQMFEGIWEAQSGTMYPLLNKMAEMRRGGGQILKSEKKPSPLGPVKTVYELTEAARLEVKGLLADTFENDIHFMERYLLLAAQVTDAPAYRAMILNYSNKVLQQIRAKATSPEVAELRMDALKQLQAHLKNTLQNVEFDIQQLEKLAA